MKNYYPHVSRLEPRKPAPKYYAEMIACIVLGLILLLYGIYRAEKWLTTNDKGQTIQRSK